MHVRCPHCHNVRMVELSSSPSLTAKLFKVGFRDLVSSRNLHCNRAVQFRITGFPNGPNVSVAKLLKQLEMSNRL